MEKWQQLLNKALLYIENSNLPSESWTFGGGTVLMLQYGHRYSKDIDIFVTDRQLLNYLSPKTNDTLENELKKYTELSEFTRLNLEDGEIDFIYSPNISGKKATEMEISSKKILVDRAEEIICKKIFHRADTFKARDVFDLATVYSRNKYELLKCNNIIKNMIPVLQSRIEALHNSGMLENGLQEINILENGKKIRGQEYKLCQDFIKNLTKKQSNSLSL